MKRKHYVLYEYWRKHGSLNVTKETGFEKYKLERVRIASPGYVRTKCLSQFKNYSRGKNTHKTNQDTKVVMYINNYVQYIHIK